MVQLGRNDALSFPVQGGHGVSLLQKTFCFLAGGGAVLALALALGLVPSRTPSEAKDPAAEVYGAFYTGEAEGHWLLIRAVASGAFIHHPDCPCAKGEKP